MFQANQALKIVDRTVSWAGRHSRIPKETLQSHPTGKVSSNAGSQSTTILAKDWKVEIVEIYQLLALLDWGRTLDRTYNSRLLYTILQCHKREQDFMQDDFVCLSGKYWDIVISAVLKRERSSLLLRVQILAYTIRAYLDKVVKYSVHYYAGITPANGTKVTRASWTHRALHKDFF